MQLLHHLPLATVISFSSCSFDAASLQVALQWSAHQLPAHQASHQARVSFADFTEIDPSLLCSTSARRFFDSGFPKHFYSWKRGLNRISIKRYIRVRSWTKTQYCQGNGPASHSSFHEVKWTHDDRQFTLIAPVRNIGEVFANR